MKNLTNKNPRLRWRREPRATGLMSVGQGERGYDLIYGDTEVANVSVYNKMWTKDKIGYFWSCGTNEELNIEHCNTAHRPVLTVEEAKDEALAYIKAALGKK